MHEDISWFAYHEVAMELPILTTEIPAIVINIPDNFSSPKCMGGQDSFIPQLGELCLELVIIRYQ